jgi:hypothetical protein
MSNDVQIDIGAKDKAGVVLDRLDKRVDKMDKRMNKLSKSAANSVKAFLGFSLVTASLRKVGDELERIDKIAKTSRKLGLLTKDLIGIRFAAAEMSGMAEGQVDVALQRMTRRLADAASKSKDFSLSMDGQVVKLSGVRAALKKVGLSAEELNAKGPAAAFRDISDAMKELENPADKLLLSFQLFDTEGAALATTLSGGSEAIDQMQQKAESLGLTFSDLEANKVEAANDAMFELKATFGSIATEITFLLIPAIDALTDAFAWLNATSEDGGKSILGHIEEGRKNLVAMLASMPFLFSDVAPVIGGNGREDPFMNIVNGKAEDAARKQKTREQLVAAQRQKIIDDQAADPGQAGKFTEAIKKSFFDPLKKQGEAIGAVGKDMVRQAKTAAALQLFAIMNPNSVTTKDGKAKTDAESDKKGKQIAAESFQLFASEGRLLGGRGGAKNESLEQQRKLAKKAERAEKHRLRLIKLAEDAEARKNEQILSDELIVKIIK